MINLQSYFFLNLFSDQRIINHEKDFLLVSPNNKCIIVIEAKSTLGAGDSIDKSMDQLLNTKADLESYFASKVLTENPWMSSEWVFVPMLYCEEIEQDVKISQTCVDFVIQGKLPTFTQTVLHLYSLYPYSCGNHIILHSYSTTYKCYNPHFLF